MLTNVEWVLILTMTIQFQDGAVSIEHVPGFRSQAACLAAAEKWGKAVVKKAPPGSQMTAVCVDLYAEGPAKK